MEDPEIGEPAMWKDQSTAGWSDESWEGSASSWLKARNFAVHDSYGNLRIWCPKGEMYLLNDLFA